jgi:hypothetical protein
MTQLKTLEHYGPSLNLIINNAIGFDYIGASHDFQFNFFLKISAYWVHNFPKKWVKTKFTNLIMSYNIINGPKPLPILKVVRCHHHQPWLRFKKQKNILIDGFG